MYNTIFSTVLLILFFWCSLGGGSSLNRTVRQTSCTSEQFRCTGGGCVSKSDVCNGWGHCADSSDEAPSICDCGTGGATGNLIGKPIKFHEAPLGAQPWFVGIYKVRHNNHHTLLCSGTLIYEDIVLTSANCVRDPSDSRQPYSINSIRISAGKLKRDYNVDESFQKKVEVKKIVVMDRYEGDTKGYARNLAIIKLNEPVKKSNFLGTACLWNRKEIPREASIVGWGLQLKGSDGVSFGNYGVNLKESLVNLMDVGVCVKTFSDPLFKRFMTNDKFCISFDSVAGYKDDDVGGPVTVLQNGRYYLIGVVSVQLPKTSFGIATKIFKHLEWIRRTVFNLKEFDTCSQGGYFNCSSNSKCIRTDLVCNNNMDCEDGSDEDPSLCSIKFQTNDNGKACEIPEGNEVFSILRCGASSGCNNKYSAPSHSRYQITCPSGRGFAKLGVSVKHTVCDNGEWIPDLKESKCLKLCPPLDYKSLQLQCQYQGDNVKCDNMMRPGTVIKVECRRQFKKQVLVNYATKTKCKIDGTLEHDISAECTPVCGEPYVQGVPLLSNSQTTKYAKYPWHTGIYWIKTDRDGSIHYNMQCGGTLIDTNKVLTAGHCIWETGKEVKDPSEIVVTFGKYYSSWNIREDSEQRHLVREIIPGNHFNGGKTQYSQDIAVLILVKDVVMSNYIMPACLDLNKNYGGIPKSQLGHLVGWGRIIESIEEPSPELMETYMKYLDLDACRKKYESYGFSSFLQSDKFCVEYNNGSGPQHGDSGGGLTFTHDNLHYIYGVVSVKKGGQNNFAAFTNVLSHAGWLNDILLRY